MSRRIRLRAGDSGLRAWALLAGISGLAALTRPLTRAELHVLDGLGRPGWSDERRAEQELRRLGGSAATWTSCPIQLTGIPDSAAARRPHPETYD